MLKKGMLITAEMLWKKVPCDWEAKIFEREWPDGATLRKKNILRAAALELDIDWFARAFLPASARKKYDKARATAWKKYDEAIAPAWKKYEEAIAPALAKYREATASALAKYREATAPAWKKYDKARAMALWQVLTD